MATSRQNTGPRRDFQSPSFVRRRNVVVIFGATSEDPWLQKLTGRASRSLLVWGLKCENKQLDHYDPTQEDIFGIMLDANNIYGGVMELFPLPLNDFESEKTDLLPILNTLRTGHQLAIF